MINNLKTLFTKITEMLKTKKLEELKYLLNDYNGNDWNKYVKYNQNKYNREIAFKNELCEMVIISWDKKQMSPIHNHPTKGCLLKILKGELIEENYINENNIVKKINTNKIKDGIISYKIGNKILHKIINNNIKSVSLHIYSPPNHRIKIYI
tara:strand:+ start:125 stop:580 length:456 start_codon:yes stop_codon:yes gene_type:complete